MQGACRETGDALKAVGRPHIITTRNQPRCSAVDLLYLVDEQQQLIKIFT